jgi:exopolyphosphatase / guanosine-5'-triphosphate,3'-diphosphate pyrophosphatase
MRTVFSAGWLAAWRRGPQSRARWKGRQRLWERTAASGLPARPSKNGEEVLDFSDRRTPVIETSGHRRRQSVLMLAKRFDAEDAHGRQVARLALRLFDATRHLHRLGEREREILEFAALLHDVGRAISYSKHHKHSHYLITHGELEGFAPEEIEMIAATARYHRGSEPKASHGELAALPASAAATVMQLAAILRVADGLDRGHRGIVRDLTVLRRNRLIRIYVDSGGDAAAFELLDSARAAEMWGRLFDVTLELKPRRPGGQNGGRTTRSSLTRRLGTR